MHYEFSHKIIIKWGYSFKGAYGTFRPLTFQTSFSPFDFDVIWRLFDCSRMKNYLCLNIDFSNHIEACLLEIFKNNGII